MRRDAVTDSETTITDHQIESEMMRSNICVEGPTPVSYEYLLSRCSLGCAIVIPEVSYRCWDYISDVPRRLDASGDLDGCPTREERSKAGRDWM